MFNQRLHLESGRIACSEKKINFLMVHLREVSTSGDMLHSIGISKKIYFTKLIWFIFHKWLTSKVQYSIGMAFLLLSPMWYKIPIFLWLIWEMTLCKVICSIQLVSQNTLSEVFSQMHCKKSNPTCSPYYSKIHWRWRILGSKVWPQ